MVISVSNFPFMFTVDDRRSAVAVITGITASAPFSGVSDQNLAVAYISALMLFYMVQ